MSAWILVIMVADYGSPNLETHRWLTEEQCIAMANAIKVPRQNVTVCFGPKGERIVGMADSE